MRKEKIEIKKKSFLVFIFGCLAVSLVLAFLISPFASSFPDGLEKVAEDHGFLVKGEVEPLWKSAPISDYEFRQVKNPYFSTGMAGLVGTFLVFGIAFIFSKWLRGPKCE